MSKLRRLTIRIGHIVLQHRHGNRGPGVHRCDASPCRWSADDHRACATDGCAIGQRASASAERPEDLPRCYANRRTCPNGDRRSCIDGSGDCNVCTSSDNQIAKFVARSRCHCRDAVNRDGARGRGKRPGMEQVTWAAGDINRPCATLKRPISIIQDQTGRAKRQVVSGQVNRRTVGRGRCQTTPYEISGCGCGRVAGSVE